ncbi:putative phosphothreonine lyase domain-containing protein [Nocardiopsis alborubida]|uniref:DUF1917 domain-containing protein n=1 Tax=Nocardiopsis alborubida TaxID=146802 RepID=A0A7X6M8K8_9ACTN|nr:putative phosphothreonine lyase domain-containg protein [Nocardiopsis alborubida]NKY96693.1 DUF1917 domain-containing protein [Nocardiopsis alborubida]
MSPWRYAVNLAATETERKEVAELVNAGFTGKWMPFTAPERVNGVWAAIVEATEAGRLGWKAKVATENKPGKDRLICVYTRDWRDRRDVARVLGELRAMGIDQRLSYKEDAATHALLYGQGASLYVAGPGSEGFTQRRDACTTEDQHPIFGAPGEELERTPEEIFARAEPYGPFPS